MRSFSKFLPTYFLTIKRLNLSSVKLNDYLIVCCSRNYCQTQTEGRKDTIVIKNDQKAELTLGQKVIHGSKLMFYLSFFGVGLITLGVIVWSLGQELFSSKSPSKIYDKAFKMIKQDRRVGQLLGTNLKAYGSESRNRRARHQPTVNTYFNQDGILCLKMMFKINGSKGKATALVDVEHYQSSNDIRSIYVQSDFTKETIQVI
jgi:TIM21-like protein, mitochondrial